MTGIDDAQARWGQVRSKSRTRLIIAAVVAVAVLVVIAVVAKGSAGIAVGVIVGLLVVVLGAYVVVSKQRTGLGLTPEWAPKEGRREYDDEDDEEAVAPAVPAEPAEPVEPLRKVDAQILGVDLAGLGQPIGDKLQKSYALGNLLLDGGRVAWEPTQISAGQGAQTLTAAPDDVAVVERAPMWGSWAMFRVEVADGREWCFRIPSSVDLAPGLAEMGLTLRQS